MNKQYLIGTESEGDQSVGETKEELAKMKELLDSIRDSFNGGNNSSFWGFDDISQVMSNYQALLDHLTLHQKYAMIHILLSIIIFISLLNMVTIYLGDELIKYLKLEQKYPKVSKYIQLRRKFITYYLMFDALIIFVALFVIVGFNLYNILY